ncbi:MAG: hypothetical protein HOC23_04845 [Halieaceae bacterium]|jgi:hypothetical protein|nr:hypothetical protein [Halieaceae bacterium]
MRLNTEWFKRNGILIPRTGAAPSGAHQPLLSTQSDELWTQFHDELQRATDAGLKVAAISWEGVNFFKHQELIYLGRALENYRVAIICYVREQAELVQSGYFQQVKRRARPMNYQQLSQSPQQLYPINRDYTAMLKRVSDVLKPESITARVFDRSQLVNGDSVVDFLDAIGLQPDQAFQTKPSPQNISLDLPSVALLNALDPFYLARELPINESAEALGIRAMGKSVVQFCGALNCSQQTLCNAMYHYLKDQEGRDALVDILLTDIELHGSGERYFLSREKVDSVRAHFAETNRHFSESYQSNSNQTTLFSNPAPCISASGESAVLQAMHRKLGLVVSLAAFAPWNGRKLIGAALTKVAGSGSGWLLRDDSLVASGKSSYIRFRLPKRGRFALASAIQVKLTGGYFGAIESTDVFVNRAAPQSLALDKETIVIAAAQIQNYGVVEIELRHGQSDASTSHYRLTALNCTVSTFL